MGQLVKELRNRGNLTEAVIAELSSRLNDGTYAPGQKLPAERELGLELGVSRTVVREAVASLRLGGRLISRQGVGVFVADAEHQNVDFNVGIAKDIRAAIHILELRIAVEAEAVALAAQRRKSNSLSNIAMAFEAFNELDGSDLKSAATADFAFHLAIARATGNPQFPHFLEALGHEIVFDLGLKYSGQASSENQKHFLKKISREHAAIFSAIKQGDQTAARNAVRRHLETSLIRYRRLISDDR